LTTDGDLYKRLGAVEQAMATLTERQAGFAVLMDERTIDILVHVKETNGRVGILERGQWIAMGAIGVILALMSVFGVWALTKIP
jgi:hypothetical protein